MSLLATLMENEAVQNYISSQENAIAEAADSFSQYPQQIKNYIAENLDEFVVVNDLNATYENIVNFTSSAVETSLFGICESIEENS